MLVLSRKRAEAIVIGSRCQNPQDGLVWLVAYNSKRRNWYEEKRVAENTVSI